jgi:hypothetical protein
MFGENGSVRILYFLDISKDPDNSNVLYFRSDAPAYWLGYQTYNDLQVPIELKFLKFILSRLFISFI